MKKALSFVSLCALALSACQPAGDNDPIKIGFIGPLTGDVASIGTTELSGAQLKIEEINAAGGINGRQIELIVEDARCTGADAASAAQKLIHVDKVVAIHGGECSGETLAAAPIAEEAGVILLSPASSSPDVAEAGDFVFRNYPNDALKTIAMANYLEEQGFNKIAVITENTDFTIAFLESLRGEVAEDAIIFSEIVEPGTKDFRTLITRLKDMEFDVFFPNGQTPVFSATVVKQMREQGLEQPVITHDTADSVDYVEVGGESVEGSKIISIPSITDDSEFGSTFLARFDTPAASLAWAAYGYDAIGVLAEAIAEVGTDGAAMRDYLYGLKAYNGVIGTFSFDENGDVVGVTYALKDIQDGEFVIVSDITVE
ncbi:ABC transporter substrate-binding protein [Patescibacteria group bacterium]|nr:ABC transporter substrate-binding protein [Patescibacteria group bacterium]